MNGTHSAVVTLTLARVVSVTVTDDTLSVDLEDGRTIAVPIGWYPRLAHGTPAERTNVQISGAGYGMHWPDLDEDIGIEGLLVGKQSTESATSFERWLQRRKARQPQETASTVGMPVARHPPYSPGRAVFPHPVLRLYALPRCQAEPSGTHAPTWNLRHTRTRSLDAVEAVGQRLPRVAPRLASPPVEPLKR